MQETLLASDLTQSIIGGFFSVYNHLGYGLSESIYSGALELELRDRGHAVIRELVIDVRYKGRHAAFQRLDMVIDDRVIIEIKAAQKIAAADRLQIISYLRATTFEVGLLLHFAPTPAFERFIDHPKRANPPATTISTRV